MNLHDYLERIPKIDIHSHLVGCIRAVTLEEFARTSGFALPRPAAELFPYSNFYEFIEIYNAVTTMLKTREQFARVIFEALEDGWHTSNQWHTEVFFNPQYSMALGVPYATVVDGLCDGIERAKRELGVSCLLIPSISREIDTRGASEVMDAILAHRRDEVVGVGIDGPERAGPPARFAEFYRRAGAAGLKRTAHVCEDNQTLEEAPPSNFAVCLDILGCDRFDHGYNLLADADMVARARDSGKNFTTVALASAAARRQKRWDNIIRMLDEGLSLSLNTDNPAMFSTHLTHSWQVTFEACGWGREQAQSFTEEALNACWLEASDKQALKARIDAAVGVLDAQAAMS